MGGASHSERREHQLSALVSELRASLGQGADRERSRAERRACGAFFTPEPLVEFMVGETLARVWRRARPSFSDAHGWSIRVLDPACGDGRFLRAAHRWLVRRAVDAGADESKAAELIAKHCLLGVERDPQFAAVAKRECYSILVADALACSTELGAFDVVLGNPPYIRVNHLSEGDRKTLQGRYSATSFGEWDLYTAFIEQSLAWLNEHGESALLVPSRWLSARSAELLRDQLASSRSVSELVDFGAEQVFADATTYASVLWSSRRPNSSLRVARLRDGQWHCGEVESASLGRAPWNLSVGAPAKRVRALTASGVKLMDVARVAKGAGTNADAVFILDGWRLESGLLRNKEGAAVEPELTRACVRGRDIQGLCVAGPSATRGSAVVRPFCLVPYREDGALLEPDELRSSFPNASRYLESQRERLSAREKGRFAGDRFYRFGRPQNMALFLGQAPRVIVPDVVKEGRALVDRRGLFAIDSSYAVVPSAEYSVELLAAILASPVARLWLSEMGVFLRGAYVRMKTAYLREMPLPALSPHTRAIEEAVRGAQDLTTVAGLVEEAYKYCASEVLPS